MNRRRLPAELLLLVCVTIWSGNFTMTKLGLAEFSPFAFFLIRYAVGGFVTVVVSTVRTGVPRFQRRDLPLLLAGALVGVSLNQICFLVGLSQTTAANSSMLVGTTPIWAATVVTIGGIERVSRRRWLLVATGMVGVTLIVTSGAPGGAGSLAGDLLSLGGAITWGTYTVLVRPLMRRYSASRVSAFMIVVGIAALAPIAVPALIAQDFGHVTTRGWLGLLYASLLAVALTNVLYFRAVGEVGATRAALFGYLEPFLGVLIAYLVIGDHIAPLQLLGGAVVLASVAIDRQPVQTDSAAALAAPTLVVTESGR